VYVDDRKFELVSTAGSAHMVRLAQVARPWDGAAAYARFGALALENFVLRLN